LNYDILKKEGGLKSYVQFSNDVPRGEPPRFIEGAGFASLRSLRRGRPAVDRVLEEGTRKETAPVKPEAELAPKASATSAPTAVSSAEALDAASPAETRAIEVNAAKTRVIARLRDERGSISLKPASAGPSLLDDLITVGRHYFETAAQTFTEWSKRMVAEIGAQTIENKRILILETPDEVAYSLPG
jgi:hypothetical protein